MRTKLRAIKKRLKLYASVNWYKTLYFNFKMFPFSEAKILPVMFYGKVKFSNLNGQIKIEAPLKKGMIGFGQQFDFPTTRMGIAELHLGGTWVFKKDAHIGKDCVVFIGKDAYCEFGFMACLGSRVKLICKEKIILGNWAGIGYESQLIDTNMHPMKNMETNELYPLNTPIYLGKHNAVSNRVSIMPGTVTPNNCVIASNSLCNKNYTQHGEYILLGGIPAKIIRKQYARDWESEKELLKQYKILWV